MCEKYLGSEQEKPIYHQPVSGIRREKISYMDRLPNEILKKILTEALLSSGFSRPSHVCQTFNDLRNVSAHFCRITSRLAWTLLSIHIANGGAASIVSVKTLLGKFGKASGLVIEVRNVIARRNWKNSYLKLPFHWQGWFMIENIPWK